MLIFVIMKRLNYSLVSKQLLGIQLFSKNRVAPMKKEFNEKLERTVIRKKGNSIYFIDSDRYEEFILQVKDIKQRYHKSYEDYKMLANYDITEINGKERLIKPQDESNPTIKFYVRIDELFGVLHTIHLLFGHANKDVMDAELKTKYCNVSKEVIKIYLTCCEICNSQSA